MFALGIGEFRVMRAQKRKRGLEDTTQNRGFALLPERRYDFLTNWILRTLPISSSESYKQLLSIFSPFNDPTKFNVWTEENKATLFAAYHETLEHRWLFRRFLQRIRLRNCKIINDVDPFTLDAVQDPIYVHTLVCHSIHSFETRGIAKQLTANLMEHDGFFHEPRFPINPFTNLRFTLFDLHMIIKEIRKKEHSNWILESLRSCGYDLGTWQQKFEGPIRTHIIESVMKDLSGYDCIDYMLEFVELQYDITDRQYNEQFFKWIFMNADCIDYTKMWQKEAKKYYVAKYTLVDAKEQSTLDIRTAIACRRLLDVPDYIRDLYMKRLKITRNDRILTVITLLEEA
jgi:hypothetical protein